MIETIAASLLQALVSKLVDSVVDSFYNPRYRLPEKSICVIEQAPYGASREALRKELSQKLRDMNMEIIDSKYPNLSKEDSDILQEYIDSIDRFVNGNMSVYHLDDGANAGCVSRDAFLGFSKKQLLNINREKSVRDASRGFEDLGTEIGVDEVELELENMRW
jgi:hypothetical protein